MIKLEHVVLASPEQMEFIIEGMRNPMNSWDKSDSFCIDSCTECTDRLRCAREMSPLGGLSFRGGKYIGPNDHSLMQRLANAGTDHRKFMRMMPVYVRITAPLYWWSEYDTYKVGTVANSCSKMHKLLAKPFEMSDFSFDKLPGYKNEPRQFRPEIDEDLEDWLPLKGDNYDFPGYFISCQGRIKHGDRILAGSLHKDGYIFYSLYKDNKMVQVPGHRLVADVFIPQGKNRDYVNHIDGNKQNNIPQNLEWCTASENIQHSINNNLQPKGLSTYTGKFSNDEREKMKERWNNGDFKSKREMAKIYGVSHTCINDILSNKYACVKRENIYENLARSVIDSLNELRDAYLNCDNNTEKKEIWYSIIQLLPSSYNQTRNVMMNYEVLSNIYKSRKDHKLDEWKEFCKWIEELPYSELIVSKEED